MIKVYITKDQIKVTGHAKPEVCAAVSATMYVTANNLLDMQVLGIDDGKCIIDDNPNADYMLIKVEKHSKITDTLMHTLKESLYDIRDGDWEHIQIIKES